LNVGVEPFLAAARHSAKLVSLTQAAVSSAVTDLVEQLGLRLATMPTSPVLHVMSDQLRIPDGYFGVSTHQDWPSIQGGLDTLTMWMPLMDVDERNYPLDVIPRSHLRGVLPGRVRDHELEIDPNLYDEADFV